MADFSGRKYNILSRFTFDASERCDPGSEVVLIGGCNLPKVDDWYGDDCMPQDGSTHTIDWLSFGKDGNLFVSVGDGETFEGETWPDYRRNWLGPMDPKFLGGKILRINPENGQGLPDNPYWDGNPTSAASRVWAAGMRNPFRCAWIPNTDNDIMVGLACGRAALDGVGHSLTAQISHFSADKSAGSPRKPSSVSGERPTSAGLVGKATPTLE